VIRPAGMIWHTPDHRISPLLMTARNSQPGSRCSPLDPGYCLRSTADSQSTTVNVTPL